MTFTPKQYAKKYRNLKVKFEDGTVSTVAVTKYRIGMGDEKTKDTMWNVVKKHFKSNDSLTVTVFPVRESVTAEHTFNSRNEVKFSVLNAFWGKASPEDYIARVLGRKPWYEQVGDGAVAPKTKSNSMFARYTRVAKLDQLPVGTTYVMAYCNSSGTPHGSSPTGHIVITEPLRMQDTMGMCRTDGDSLARFTVSESTGGIGVITSEYQVREALLTGTSKAYFKLHRGSKNKIITMAVAEVTAGT